METGEFTVEVGQSSRDIELCEKVTVKSTVRLNRHYTIDSIFMDIMDDPKAMEVLKPMLDSMAKLLGPSEDDGSSAAAKEAISDEMSMAMLRYMPLRGAMSFGGGAVTPEMMNALLDALNNL